MKAAIFKAVGQPLSIEDRPVPQPGDTEILLKVHRCGMCGTDVHMTSGHGPMFPLGSVLGHEYAGEVVEIGRKVDGFKIGDKISALPMVGCRRCAHCLAGRPLACAEVRSMMGGFGGFTLADESVAVKLPATLSMSDGALVEPLASALRGVTMARVSPHDRVLVLGAGAIGLGAIFWARRQGAGKIVATARSPAHLDRAVNMGADAYLLAANLTQESVSDALGGPPTVVIECTGAAGMTSQAINLVTIGGTVVCLGICPGCDSFVPATASYKEVAIRFSAAYTVADFEVAVATLGAGAVEPATMITETIALRDVPETLERMRSGKHAGKILVGPWL